MLNINQPVETVPLRTVEGTIYVGQTRVPLLTVIESFLEGATAEEIVSHYPSLDLSEVYAVVAYYLRHQQEVDKYLAQIRQRAEAVRAENEQRFQAEGIRARLLKRHLPLR